MKNSKDVSKGKRMLRRKTAKHGEGFNNNLNKGVIVSGILLIILAVLSTGFALANINNDNIIAGISIDGIKMQGFSKEDAKELIDQKVQEKINKEIKIYVDEEIQTILLSQIELSYDVEQAIQEAHEIGRGKNIFVNNFEILKSMILKKDINIKYSYNEDLLKNIVIDIKNKVPNAVVQPTHCVEEEELIITRGKKGYTINEKELKNKIIEIIKLNREEDINVLTYLVEPEEINIDKIYEEAHFRYLIKDVRNFFEYHAQSGPYSTI